MKNTRDQRKKQNLYKRTKQEDELPKALRYQQKEEQKDDTLKTKKTKYSKRGKIKKN